MAQSSQNFLKTAQFVVERFRKTILKIDFLTKRLTNAWLASVETITAANTKRNKKSKKTPKPSVSLSQIPQEIIHKVMKDVVRRVLEEYCIIKYEKMRNKPPSLDALEEEPKPKSGLTSGTKSPSQSPESISQLPSKTKTLFGLVNHNQTSVNNLPLDEKESSSGETRTMLFQNFSSFQRVQIEFYEMIHEAEGVCEGNFGQKYQTHFERGLEFSFTKEMLKSLQKKVVDFLNFNM
jgi:hypothetical protein